MDRLQRTIAGVPLWLAALFCIAFIVLPIGAMLLETIHGPHGFSLEPWKTILATDVDRQQLWNSITLGLVATAIGLLLGLGYAWFTFRTDLPGGAALLPLGIAPLAVPPIFVAMGFADMMDVSGFWLCATMLGASYTPFVAVMAAHGLRSVDGRSYESALVARGRWPAERMLLRSILPEIAAGCLLVFVFVISEHGVPEFLSVKGKTWHTYAEGVFSRWKLRATGLAYEDIVSPMVAALPLIVIIAIALAVALRLRTRANLRSDVLPLPVRRLGRWRWPALLLPTIYLGMGVGVPLFVMGRWTAGSSQVKEPMSLAFVRKSFQDAFAQAGDDLARTTGIAFAATVLAILVAVPLARRAGRGHRWIDRFSVLPIAVPAVLLTIGMVDVYNSDWANDQYRYVGDFYASWGIVACTYAARFLPFGVLTLSQAVRRQPPALEEAAALTGRGPIPRALRIHLPLLWPAVWSAACLVFVLGLRELDMAVVLPSGNGTIVRRLSNVVHFGGEDVGGALALLLLFTAALFPLLTLVLTGRKLRSLS